MITAVPEVRNIDISGSTCFLEKINSLVSRLKAKRLPVKLRTSDEVPNKTTDGGFITIELTTPKNGIKTGLFHVVNGMGSRKPLIHRFTLTSGSESQKVLGLTFTMNHPDYESALLNHIEELIGNI